MYTSHASLFVEGKSNGVLVPEYLKPVLQSIKERGFRVVSFDIREEGSFVSLGDRSTLWVTEGKIVVGSFGDMGSNFEYGRLVLGLTGE